MIPEEKHPTPEADDQLSQAEQATLLELARQALQAAVCRQPRPFLDLAEMPANLRAPGATFVTLHWRGELRGCVGTLEASQPLAEDVRVHAVAAALQDYRFPPVQPEELPDIRIEISRLTAPQPLQYKDSNDLLTMLRPHVDGVLLRDGPRRATFLPQVWAKIPDPAIFLTQLCLKMGVEGNLWRYRRLAVYTYQVEEFSEPD